MKRNLNTLAKEVCELEGGKVNLSIAQVKEVIKCLIKIQHSCGNTLVPDSPIVLIDAAALKLNKKPRTKKKVVKK